MAVLPPSSTRADTLFPATTLCRPIPGHGRALLDSHEDLPVVAASDRELQSDRAPFAALRDAAMAMTCHVVFNAWDPDRPATLSSLIVDSVIRRRIGFHG